MSPYSSCGKLIDQAGLSGCRRGWCPGVAGEAGGDAEGDERDEGEREGDGAPVAVEAVEAADGVPPAGLVPPHGHRSHRPGAGRRRRLQVHRELHAHPINNKHTHSYVSLRSIEMEETMIKSTVRYIRWHMAAMNERTEDYRDRIRIRVRT